MSYIRLERFSDFYPDVPLDGRRKRLPEHLLECLGIRMYVLNSEGTVPLFIGDKSLF